MSRACQGLYSHDTGNYEIDEENYKIHSVLSDVSHQILDIGTKLELSYPSLYVDLPRQLNMPLRSQVVVLTCTCTCDVMDFSRLRLYCPYPVGSSSSSSSSSSRLSSSIVDIGTKLELSYPSLYVDLPRQLNMPLRSQVVVAASYKRPLKSGSVSVAV